MLVVPPGSGIVHQVNLEYLGRVVFNNDGLLYPDSVVGTDSHTTSRYKRVEVLSAFTNTELDFALLFPERHVLLCVLPILIVLGLATSSDKDSESLYEQNDAVIPTFPDLHLQ
ncbi:hypothetical protein K1719_024525 [Acacia pycnantha]|nr:hypothetical protein K1719_024525 [Acacia pycnantha]